MSAALGAARTCRLAEGYGQALEPPQPTTGERLPTELRAGFAAMSRSPIGPRRRAVTVASVTKARIDVYGATSSRSSATAIAGWCLSWAKASGGRVPASTYRPMSQTTSWQPTLKTCFTKRAEARRRSGGSVEAARRGTQRRCGEAGEVGWFVADSGPRLPRGMTAEPAGQGPQRLAALIR